MRNPPWIWRLLAFVVLVILGWLFYFCMGT